MKVERQSNIELLRILAIMGVIVLHYGNPSIGGGLLYVKEGTANCYVLYFLISLFACAVDLFMIISGYFMCTAKSVVLWKPVKLIIQVILFRMCIYFLSVAFGNNILSLKTVVGRLLPVNYFVILYCTVYMLAPFINTLLDRLTAKNCKQLMFCCFLLFSVYPTLVDVLTEFAGKSFNGLSTVGMYGSQWGYSIVNFILMYMIGAYLRKCDNVNESTSTKKLLVRLGICLSILMLWAKMNDVTGFFTERSAWEYCNPIIILEAVIIFSLFKRLNFGVNHFINSLAEGVFTVYLLHGIFIKRIGIKHYVSESVLLMILHILISVSVIYFICFLAHKVYSYIETHAIDKITNKIELPLLKIES